MTAQAHKTLTLQLELEPTVAELAQALESIGCTVLHSDPRQGLLLALHGPSLRSWGEHLRVTLTPTESGCRADLVSTSAVRGARFDWGANVANLRHVERALRYQAWHRFLRWFYRHHHRSARPA